LGFGECHLENNNGPVWLESLTVTGSADVGLQVLMCSAVIAARCNLNGPFGIFGPEGPGIDALDSSLYLFETTAQGTSFPPGSGSGEDGGDGVKVTNSFLFASGCSFKGGGGATGTGGLFSAGGNGGNGLVRIGGPVPQLLQTVLVGGPGGCGIKGGACGPSGEPAVGGYELVAGYARDYVLDSPATGGQTTTLNYAGKAGDFVFSLIGLSPSALYLPELAGPLVLPIPPLLISHGAADGAGQLQAVVSLPPLPPGFEAFTVYAQSAAVSTVGAAVLGAPSQLSIL